LRTRQCRGDTLKVHLKVVSKTKKKEKNQAEKKSDRSS